MRLGAGFVLPDGHLQKPVPLLRPDGYGLRSDGAWRLRQVAALKFPVPLWPFAPAAAIVFMLFIFVVLGYFPDTRPALWVGAIWIAVLVIAYRRWVRPKGDAAHGVLQAQGGL